jgi:hypothetical protein
MSKSNKYGYVGVDIPEQSFGNNKGIFDPAEINELVADNKYTQYGQLELIETQNITTAVSNIDFTNLKEDIYREHLLTCTNVETLTDQRHLVARFSNDNGSTFETSSYRNVYLANNSQGGQTANTFLQYLSSSLGTASNEIGNGWIKFYNLGNSADYSYCTSAFEDITYAGTHQTNLGGASRIVKETVNAIRLTGNSTTTWKGKFSLYGYREYK